MANINAPQGLVYKRGPSELRSVLLKSDYATAVFVGDVVTKTSDGANATVVSSGGMTHAIGTLPIVNRSTLTATNKITGVVVGFEHIAGSTGVNKHNPASTERVAIIECHPDAVYEVQGNAAITATMVGLNAGLVQTAAGSTVTGRSGIELDVSGTAPAADATYQLLIVGLVKDPLRNDVSSTNTCAEVKLNVMTNDARNVLGI